MMRSVSRLGTEGCGFEQQLESMLKALTPSDSSIRFEMNTAGQGDRANAGFVRPDSLLAIIVVTDEDDGSTIDPQLYADPGTSAYLMSASIFAPLTSRAATPDAALRRWP